MKTFQYIGELLYNHNCVIVPGFGGFISNSVHASIHPVTNGFLPPRKEILFNNSLKTNDGVLINYIARKENLSYNQAEQLVNKEVSEWRNILEKDKQLIVLKVGTLLYNDNGQYLFKPDKDSNFLIDSFGLEGFVSPAIQRDDIEKRLKTVFERKKVFRSETKKQNTLTRAALISVPAAALLVWGFIQTGTFENISNNYSGFFSDFFKSDIRSETKFASSDNKGCSFDADKVISFTSLPDISINKDTLFPSFTEFYTASENRDISADATRIENSELSCKFYVIGSCNRQVEFAENYKQTLVRKGYSNANIINPKGNGLYKVYINCFDNEPDALQFLGQVHKDENPDAWLLKM